MVVTERKRHKALPEFIERETCIQQGTHEHVTANTGKAIHVGYCHVANNPSSPAPSFSWGEGSWLVLRVNQNVLIFLTKALSDVN